MKRFTSVSRRMKLVVGFLILVGTILFSYGDRLVLSVLSSQNEDKAVFQVDSYRPTETKSQSKLWFAYEHWWAWLPDRAGSSIWKREAGGWRRIESLDDWGAQVNGVADVLSENESVVAILVGRHELTFASLRYDADQDTYVPDLEVQRWKVANEEASYDWTTQEKIQSRRKAESFRGAETASIVRGPEGKLWVTYSIYGAIFLMRSKDSGGVGWNSSLRIEFVQSSDDISTLLKDSSGVSVVWSDQANDAIMRRRYSTSDFENLAAGGTISTIAKGYKEADDHLNVAVTETGRTCIASKNDRQIYGEPTLTLRCQLRPGDWVDVDYAELTRKQDPSRPIIMSASGGSNFYVAHTAREFGIRKRNKLMAGFYQWGKGDVQLVQILPDIFDLGNVTGTKSRLPRDASWVVLASDRFGNIFEGEIPKDIWRIDDGTSD